MQDNNTDDKTLNDDALAAEAQAVAEQKVQSLDEQLGNIPKKVAEKIKACENILVALSNDPNVDEISAAIGLTMILNKLGKHVTAIYSGETPNTLEFLKPNETFEKDTNSLQDFIIALSKDKADHLRYKVEGDYVKVFITPYKTTISQNDLEFSQGDFNVDLVISIDVDSAEVLDAALEEYGRIMHDATAINITTNQAGHFAELEWSDPSKSSVCEMIVNLCEYLETGDFDQPVATALLTGIVSATERFSNARTTSETMQISSRLMQAGADQQLISSNIMQPAAPEAPAPAKTPAPEEQPAAPEAPKAPETPPEPLIPAPTLAQPTSAPAPAAPEAPTPEQQLEQAVATPVSTGMPEALATELANATPEAPEAPAPVAAPTDPTPTPEAPVEAPVAPEAPSAPEILVGTPSPVEKAPAPSLEPAGPEGLAAPESVTPEPIQQPAPATPEASDTLSLPGQTSPDDVQAAMNAILNPGATPEEPKENALPEIVSQGSVMAQNVAEPLPETPDYGAMIDQALSDAMGAPANPAAQAAPIVSATPTEASSVPTLELNPTALETPATPAAEPAPAATPATPETPAAPAAPTAPEAPAQPIEVPQADIDGIELPPPPAPVIDVNGGMPPAVAVAPEPAAPATPVPAAAPAPATPETPATPAPAPTPETPATPATIPAPTDAPVLDPSAFQIPQA